MGIWFGPKTYTSHSYGQELAVKITRQGGRSSSGAAALLNLMDGSLADPEQLRGEEAEQAARSLREVARKLRGEDRDAALAIAAQAQEAADSGRRWIIRPS
ncbi:hypothetical protein [Nonomuraea sp. NPDC050202]|uniref:DUF7739 domain-containing protein n=1 Tax=Nonomuraea sp. NPDC050202 TaxID=3155035 RepID=UPI0033CDEFEB